MSVLSADPFASLVPKRERRPGSASILESWINDAAKELSVAQERISWLLATTVAIAVLQRAVGKDGEPLFLLKGGAYLERKLSLASRSTKDLDAMFRGSVDEFIVAVDNAIADPWGEIEISRSDIQEIAAPRLVKPRRFYLLLALRGRTWRRIKVEIAFPEGSISERAERIPSPTITWFGLDQPSDIVTIAMAYQIAQKLHACSEPHNPPRYENDRVRDIVDLILIRQAFYANGASLSEVRAACEDIFAVRFAESLSVGTAGRAWPPVIVTNEIWEKEFDRPAKEAKLEQTLGEALDEVETWVTEIVRA